MNSSFCNSCGKLVKAGAIERAGKIFLQKTCPSCGVGESLISGNAARYLAKRKMDMTQQFDGCGLECRNCPRDKHPNMVFIDVTNRCNLNCPICINNTPSMGFLFEPPLAYFEKIFKHFSAYNPRPAVQLFGGEPTVRKDLFEIIKLSKGHGLATRVVTNGLALADEEYCRKLVETRATILIAYDGDSPDTYRILRGSESVLEKKQRALENLKRIGGAKVVLMSLVAKGFNDRAIPQLLEYCHRSREMIRGVYFMPLAHNWDDTKHQIHADRITCEDIEDLIADIFPGENVEFVAAGFLGQLKTLIRRLGVKPLPFAGAHPNCESMYLLVSDGVKYVPLNHYLRGTTGQVSGALVAAERSLNEREERMQRSLSGRILAALRLRNPFFRLCAVIALARMLLRWVRLARLLKGGSIAKAWHACAALAKLALGRRSKEILSKHSNVEATLQIIVLPFEDRSTLETDRLERCPSGFAYVDPKDGTVRTVSTCAWGLHKTAVMREIMVQAESK